MTDHKPFTADEIAALAAALNGVTPGPWSPTKDSGIPPGAIVTLSDCIFDRDRTYGYGCGNNFICSLNDGEYHEYSDPVEQAANARFIATFAPPTVSRMLAEIRALRAALQPFAKLVSRLPDDVPNSSQVEWCGLPAGNFRRAADAIGGE